MSNNGYYIAGPVPPEWTLFMKHVGLIYKLAQKAEWTGIDFSERVGKAFLWGADIYVNKYDPERGALSTILTYGINNNFIKEYEKHYKKASDMESLDACIQMSCEKQISAEKRLRFFDGISKISEDGKLLIRRLLHPSRKIVSQIKKDNDDKYLLRYVREELMDKEDWSVSRYYSAVKEIKNVLYSRGESEYVGKN